MTDDRYVILTVAYDRLLGCGRILDWIAPDLSGAGLVMVEDRGHEPSPSRTWAGIVNGPTFVRFADAWHLEAVASEPVLMIAGEDWRLRGREYTLDGMNWEWGGESPIVYVSVHVARLRDRRAARAEGRSRLRAHA